MLSAPSRVPFLPGIKAPAGNASAAFWFGTSCALVAVVAALDYVTPYEVRFATLYLFPIALGSWRLGARAGAFLALASTVGWMVTAEVQHPYVSGTYFYLEGASKGATYLFIAWLVARLREALAHADQRFVTVLDGLAAAVFVEEPGSGAVLFANPRYRKKFGEARPAALPVGLAADFAGELHDSRTRAWYLVRSRALRWIDGREVVLRLVSDITEEKRVRELMERHRESMDRSARLVALGEFASAIAHEINQPLAAIATYNDACLRMVEAGQADAAEVADAMRKCREQARRAGAIIRRLREFLRERAPALADEGDLNTAAGDVLRALEADAERDGIALRFEPAPALPSARMDRLLVEQVVLNLVRNALDAVRELPPSRRAVRVATAREADGGVRFEVEDRGAGVAPGVLLRLFEPFVSNKAEGLGLGLSICRSVVESHGGRISHAALPGGGTRFSFTLPGGEA